LKENSVKNKQITSLSDLDKAAVDLKRAYEKFRDFRTEQCKEEIKKDFFDSLNKQVKEIKASGKPLSPEDKKVLECAKQYGITGDKEGQPLTPNQRKAREELRIENLPKNLQIQFEKRKQYYADIYTAKIAAVDLTCAQIRFDHRKDHHSLNLSVKELDTMIRGHLPPADKMNSETIQKTLQGIKEEHQALQQKQRQAQRNGYEKNMETMTKYMTSENNGKTSKKQKSQQICEHIQRRTFKENVSLKNLAWNQSSRR